MGRHPDHPGRNMGIDRRLAHRRWPRAGSGLRGLRGCYDWETQPRRSSAGVHRCCDRGRNSYEGLRSCRVPFGRNECTPSKRRVVPEASRLWAVFILKEVAHPERFERPTPRFVVWCSIQLSYGCGSKCGGAACVGDPLKRPFGQCKRISKKIACWHARNRACGNPITFRYAPGCGNPPAKPGGRGSRCGTACRWSAFPQARWCRHGRAPVRGRW